MLLACLQVLKFLRQDALDIARSLMEDTRAISAMRAAHFDVVIRDMGSWALHLPAEMLQIPEVDLIGVSSLLPICETSWSIPNPVSYVPQFSSTALPDPVSVCWQPALTTLLAFCSFAIGCCC